MGSSEDERDRWIAAVATQQRRLITTKQLSRVGLSEGSIQSRVGAGRLFRVVRGVYMVGVPSLDWHALRRTALLRAGPAAFLDDLTAAQVRGLLPVNQTLATISRPNGGWTQPLRTDFDGVWGGPGSIVLRPGKAAPGEIERVDGEAIASLPRTLTSIAGNHPRQFERAWREAQYRSLINWNVMRRYVDLTHRNGIDLIAAKVQAHLGEGLGTPDSPAEFEMVQILLRAGVPEPLVNHVMLVAGQERRPDLYFPFALHVVEIDGWNGHKTQESFEDDRQRDSDFREIGISTQRFTARRAQREPERCARLVMNELNERSRLVRSGHLRLRHP
ncbi:MAG: type IV toxin-antitoxin system AbiEi family antitoxin domain-containing protein [Solirubrobacteraceae bacterium]|nr:type IV toxin-antitoxin system AbiEi family antitoxin domain-containing protein [Solirubrobacteraceae bacterium]